METIPKIASVRPLERMRLLVQFHGGEQRIYDCAQLLSRPEFQLLAVPAFFRAVRVDPGGYGVSWNDEVDISEYELFTNGIPAAEMRTSVSGSH